MISSEIKLALSIRVNISGLSFAVCWVSHFKDIVNLNCIDGFSDGGLEDSIGENETAKGQADSESD